MTNNFKARYERKYPSNPFGVFTAVTITDTPANRFEAARLVRTLGAT